MMLTLSDMCYMCMLLNSLEAGVSGHSVAVMYTAQFCPGSPAHTVLISLCCGKTSAHGRSSIFLCQQKNTTLNYFEQAVAQEKNDLLKQMLG